MAAVGRNPLVSRTVPPQSPSGHSMKMARSGSGASKRARSPDAVVDSRTKRVKGVPPSPSPAQTAAAVREEARQQEKEDRRALKEAQREEFRVKYRKAFPSWTFHFDAELGGGGAINALLVDIERLGAHVDDFFSNNVTHLITNAPVPSDFENKENVTKSRLSRPAAMLKSPIKLRTRPPENGLQQGYDIVVKKAIEFGCKIWNVAKLESVLERCLSPEERSASQPPSRPATVQNSQRNLTRLLASERLHGTSERDPTQKRHDYRYFAKNSYFVLVEDINQELAPIAVLEYPVTKTRDGKERGAWPILHCHPHARGPFVEFDEREQRRWEKQERAQREEQNERERAKMRLRMQAEKRRLRQSEERKQNDLRRTMSMNSLRRNATFPEAGHSGYVDLDADATFESAQASGYFGSNAYMAASGNSVGITSTTGTTSCAGNSSRSLQLPAHLRDKLSQQIVTTRRFPSGTTEPGATSMGPPVAIPPRKHGLLRKSRSTNTLKLPKRDEASKPGYCESCRQKFDSFTVHIKSKKHRKFAMDDANFAQLDAVLARVKRQSLADVAAQQPAFHQYSSSTTYDGDFDGVYETRMHSEVSSTFGDQEGELPNLAPNGERV